MKRWWWAAALLGGCDDGSQPADDARAVDARVVDARVGDARVEDTGGADARVADAQPGDARTPDAQVADAGVLEGPPGVDLLQRLPGLWSGSARETPLGEFALMNMDLRALEGRQLFSRFDLDAENNLRFAFAVEDVDGQPTLVYRNGGYFLGLLRDTRSVLVEAQGNRYRFCHGPRGCEYLDATFTFEGADRMTLEVRVRGQMHLRWPARRLEPRELPGNFAATSGPHDAPFPPMPTLAVRATWRGALEAPRTVWMLLTDTPCGFTGSCNPARVLSAEAPAGATEVTLRLDQVHPGDYHLNVILDRNDNFMSRLFPDRGDGIAGLDFALTVGPEGTTEVTRAISLTVP